MNQWTLPFIWLANGVLALLWLTLDNLWVVLFVPALGAAVLQAPANQQAWTLGVAFLSLAAGVIAPFPVAMMLLAITLAGLAAKRLEKLNPQNIHWTLVRGLGLYSLIGLGYTAYRAWLIPAMSDPALLQGQAYLSAIASIAVYLFPLGVLAMLAQGLFVHPPVQGDANEIIYRLRSRGKP
ncbi:MAG: hypothetical protein AB1509_14155 [Chloroflexota bacterium]|jgi:hypothetical protein